MGPPKGGWEAFAIVGVAAFVALISSGYVCLVRSWCVDAGECVAVSSNSAFPTLQCSFSNVVPLISDILYHSNATGGSLAALTRSYCGVGERLHLSAITGTPVCMLLRPYPDALDTEVMDPNGATDSDKACGAWLASGMSISSTDYLSFHDGSERAAAVRNVEAAMHAGSRLSSGNLGKFEAACHRAVLGGSAAIRAAGALAYQHLVDAAGIEAASDEAAVLQAAGVLVGHYCDGPAVLGWELEDAGYRTSVRRGVPFTDDALAQALQLVGAPSADQAAAVVANIHVNAYAWASPSATMEQLESLLDGATGRTNHTDAGLYTVGYTPELDGLLHLVNTTGNYANARGYLKGVAAMCAFSLQALVPVPGYALQTLHDAPASEAWIAQTNAQRPRASALGHLQSPPDVEPFFEIDNVSMYNASIITLSQLVGAPSGDPQAACRDFTRVMFPDEIDQTHFDLVVSPELYERMGSIASVVRAGVAKVLRDTPAVHDALLDPEAIAVDVETTRLRIPGAPRGSWAGSNRSMPVAELDSDDGVFVMAAKQARTLFLDRQGSLAYDASDPCEGPSAYAPLVQNAYIYPTLTCSYYLLGMSFRPYADEAYDDASLVSRYGYIIAHELAHNNLNTDYQSPAIDTLLARYTHASTRNEAWADVVGCLGVLETGLINATELCQHVSQAWCARVPMTYYQGTGHSHPKANRRGNYLCETLRYMGV